MPLRVIREALERNGGDLERLGTLADTGDALLDQALAPLTERTSEDEVLERFDVPRRALERLSELGVLSPDERGYSHADVRVIDAVAKFRSRGWNERTGFGARDVQRLMKGLEPVVEDEINLMLERFAALDPARAAEILEGGMDPFPELIGALHAKALTDELERQRAGRTERSG